MKKVLSLVLCIVLLFSFMGCESDKVQEDNAKATLEEFLGALFNLDVATASGLTVEGNEFAEKFENLSEDKLIEMFNNELSELEVYKDNFEPVISKIIDKSKSYFNYEIGEVTKEGKKFTFDVAVSHIDFETDFNKIIDTDKITSQDFLNEIVTEVTSSGKYTAETSEEELTLALFDLLTEKLLHIIETNIASVKTTTDNIKIAVEQYEDKWLVNSSDSGLNDFLVNPEELLG